MEDNKKMILFGPKNEKDLKRQYPELANTPEYDKLTAGELLFIWWYANPTSPLITDDNVPDKIRVGLAYEEAFKSHPNQDRKDKFLSFDFPDRIRLAIDKMKSYNPSARIRSQMIVNKILQNFEAMVNVDTDDFVTESTDEKGKIVKEINFTARNNYVNSCSKISETLPRLIEQVEQGFGVTESKSGEEGTTKAIHRFHSSHKD
jgi:hypothetical protein